MTLTILDGSTFCICDDLGDIGERTSGFFAHDTRFLSRMRLTINGERPLLLSSGKVDYYSAAFYLRNAPVDGLPQDAVSVARQRFVGEAMQDQLTLTNETMNPVAFEVALEFAADFADIFAVKNFDFALGDPLHAPPLPPCARSSYDKRHKQFVFAEDGEVPATTQVVLSKAGEIDGLTVRYAVALKPRHRWGLTVVVAPSLQRKPRSPQVARQRLGAELERVRESVTAWHLDVPRLSADWDDLTHAFRRSVSDLASLRMRTGAKNLARLPAAGMPWFMTVFGRDTIITSLQTLLFGPQLARGALEVLAELQARVDDPSRDAEPGKIVHEVREGKAARTWFDAYYGTVDATPLYLVLLSEVWRWTDDGELARGLREPALRALEWIDRYGDLDGDGFVEYERRSERGLLNQSWKDSGDSQRFADGRLAAGPIAPCEVQGYVFDAKLRIAEMAREAWEDAELADRLEREAAELRERFDAAFWVDARGGYYALALDGEKQRVDAMCSNIGHLLWSGIVPPERVEAVVAALAGDALWSGWGVRTMSTADAAYNPLSYHNGTVWPHENSLIAWGLARAGHREPAERIARAMIDASVHFDFGLPEVFAGLPRDETPFPIAYPTAARPQAWAAGTPVLLLQVLLGLRPDRAQRALVSDAPAPPDWLGALDLTGVRAFGEAWNVRVRDGAVSVERG